MLSPSMEVEEKRKRLIVVERPVLRHVQSEGARNKALEIKLLWVRGCLVLFAWMGSST